MMNNEIIDRGWGDWEIGLHGPEGTPKFTLKGELKVTKDFHTFVDSTDVNDIITLAQFPNPNIAYVISVEFVKTVEK